MIRTSRLLIAALVLVGTTGCGNFLKGIFGPPQPALEHYRLLLPPSLTDATPARAGALPGGLAILPYVTRGIYDRRGIAFRIDDYRLDSYGSREWAVPLRDMLGEATETVLRAYPLTTEAASFDPRSPRSFEYQWRGSVMEFEEVNRGQQVLAAVHLEAELVRNDSVVWSGSERIEREVPPPTNSMPRVVETLSTLTAEVLTRLAERARNAVPAPSGGAAPTAAAAPPPS